MYKVYGDNTLLVLNGTSLNRVNAPLALTDDIYMIMVLSEFMSCRFLGFISCTERAEEKK